MLGRRRSRHLPAGPRKRSEAATRPRHRSKDESSNGNSTQTILALREIAPRRLKSPLVRSGKLTGVANILPATAVRVSNGRCCKDGEPQFEAHRAGAEETQEARRDNARRRRR